MKYYSTNHTAPLATLSQAVTKGLAPDKGLYMPEHIRPLPQEFYTNIHQLTFQEIALEVAKNMFADDIAYNDLRRIVYDTLTFDCPLVPVTTGIYSLELFHGPTLAFKDVGARFMARMLRHFISAQPDNRTLNVLVATSGDTGSAVANGFLGVDGIHVYVLYPKGKVSPIQECQFTTLGQNITALEIDGVFDDCQALVKKAFIDPDLNSALRLTSANSINIARFMPQAFYYFYAYAQLKRLGKDSQMVICVPSGNFGNITAALIAHRMGLPVKRFIAANNANDVFLDYLNTGQYRPRASVATIANAMDVGDPSNFARILDLYAGDHSAITSLISGCTYTDEQIREAMRQCLTDNDYMLDPHGACGYRALTEQLLPGETGVFAETAHPAKFTETVKSATGVIPELPPRLEAFMRGTKSAVSLPADFTSFKAYLLGCNNMR